jgi:UDP-N-acetylmuramoylalanine--D-glutamate ligase
MPPAPFLVVGLGRAGLAAARALATHAGAGAVTAWDSAGDLAQRDAAQALRGAGVRVRLGGDGIAALAGARTVVKSPGVPFDVPVVLAAQRAGIEIVDEMDIGWRLVAAPTVGVTGTNGKSTVAALCVAVLKGHGMKPVLVGNTVYGPPLSDLSSAPPPRSVVAEVSSYQAESSPALALDAAIFTNLTPDHLNRYPSLEAYGEAKRRLFVRGDWSVPLASLNVDDGLGRALSAEVEERGGRALRYGQGADADYRLLDCRWGLHDAATTVEAPDGPVEVLTRLPGAHNAANAVGVLAMADGLGLPREATLGALESAAPVPGRFEVVEVDRPYDVVVDFAFSADSVAKVLATARALVTHRGARLLTVLGIPGRSGPVIGREVGGVARRLSDHLVLSGTSYRGEPRLVTLARLAEGARAARGGKLEIAVDREAAIVRALAAARAGDLVVILGRGPTDHEATDARGGRRLLDDRQVAREVA